MIWSEDKEKVEYDNAKFMAMIATQMGNNDPSIWKYMLNLEEAPLLETDDYNAVEIQFPSTQDELADLLREMDEAGWPEPS